MWLIVQAAGGSPAGGSVRTWRVPAAGLLEVLAYLAVLACVGHLLMPKHLSSRHLAAPPAVPLCTAPGAGIPPLQQQSGSPAHA